MHTALGDTAKVLFRWAMGIFLVTIVIGILNGLDLWEPPRELLLTHVHAGTLGWITLAVIGAGLIILGGGADEAATRKGQRMSQGMIVATVLYVIAFATTTGILRPITGTLMLVAIIWALVWMVGRYRAAPKTVPGLALVLSMVSLVIGAILGVLLGLFIANGEIPGIDADTAGSLAGAHPPAMLVGYLMLAGVAVAEWFLSSRPTPTSESKPGVAVAWILFIAGQFFNVAFIADVEALIQAATMLELVGVVIFIVRMWKHLTPKAWKDGGTLVYGRLSVVFFAAGFGLFMYLVQLFISGAIDPEAGEGVHLLVAFDHAMFIGVMTNALFLAMSTGMVYDGMHKAIAWGTNIGLTGFIVGLVAESSALKRVSTPIMGAALLLAAYRFLMVKTEASSAA